MRSTRTLAPTERRRDSATPIRGHGAGTCDGNGAGSDAQAPVGRRLSDFIVSEGLVSAEHLAPALAEQKKTGERLADLVVRLGLLSEATIVSAQSQHYRIPAVPFPDVLPSELLRLVPSAIARKHEVIPIGRSAGALTLAMVDPTNLAALDDVAFRTGMRVFPVISLPSRIREAIDGAWARPAEICKAARDQGMRTLREAGLAKVLEGVTTL